MREYIINDVANRCWVVQYFLPYFVDDPIKSSAYAFFPQDTHLYSWMYLNSDLNRVLRLNSFDSIAILATKASKSSSILTDFFVGSFCILINP